MFNYYISNIIKMKNYFVIILWLLVTCASQGYPSGGPIDDQGPVIINITPSSEDLSKNESIIIEFDENIDPNSISSAIRINQDDNFKLRVYNRINMNLFTFVLQSFSLNQ